MVNPLPITQFDLLTVSPHFQILKAMIPFLDFSTQKTLSMVIRIQELQSTINYYNNAKLAHHHKSQCSNNNSDSKKSFLDHELINAIMPYCPKEYSDMLNTLLQLMQMSDLTNMLDLSKINDLGNINDLFNLSNQSKDTKQPDSNSLDPMIKSLLNPSQLEAYNQYLKDLEDFKL